MNLVRILNCASFVAIALTNILCGFVIKEIASTFRHVFHTGLGNNNAIPEGAYLPAPDLYVLPVADSQIPIVAGFVIGIGVMGLLFFLEHGGEKQRAWVPFCLTMALFICFLPLILVSWAVTLPYN